MSQFSSNSPPGRRTDRVGVAHAEVLEKHAEIFQKLAKHEQEEAKLRHMLINPAVVNTPKPVEIRRWSSWEVKGILIRHEKGIRTVEIGTTELSLEDLNALRAALTEVEAVLRCS